jgi:SAM-dependent methyltransferase
MRRIHEKKIDDAKYYETVWSDEYNTRPYFDAVRMRALIRDVKDGDSVIDIGAGVFGACQYIVEKTKLNCKLYAFDQSYTAKEIINRIAPQIDYIIGDCSGVLPFADGSFDVVIAGEIIEHMEDPAIFASEICRICKPGGFVTLSTVDTNCENAKKREYPEHIWEYTPEDLIAFFSPHGVTTYEVVGDYHFIYSIKN